MVHNLTHPGSQLSHAYQNLIEIGITVLLMTGSLPLFREILVYLLMKLYEIFIQHQYLF